ncbi:29763_t:CDS:2, partial [Gigaspora margarita]
YKNEQSEVRDYEKVDQALEVQNEKKLNPLVERKKEVFQKQVRSFRKEKEIHEVFNERQGANNIRSFELKEEVCGKQKQQINKQGFRRGYAFKNKEELRRKGKEKENQHTYLEKKKTEGGLASAKSIEAIISSLMSDIKTKLYEKIQKANRTQECPNRS